MKIFQLTSVTTVALLGWFLWGIISGSLADVPKRSIAEQKMVLQTIESLAAAVSDQTAAIAMLQSTVDAKQEQIAAAIAALEAKIAEGGHDVELQAIVDALSANTVAITAATTDVSDTPVPPVSA